jgi:methylene-tetrahydromethanopterin dehydrogenase
MKVLELKPLKNKKLELILVESEFPIGWWLKPTKEQREEVLSFSFMSRDYLKLIDDMLRKYKPNFVVEEQGMRSSDKLHYEDSFVDLFRDYKIPYKMVDISENALSYLESTLDRNTELLEGIKAEIKKIKEKGGYHPNDPYFQQLLVWREYLQNEFTSQENELRFKIREAWMMMRILDIAKEREEKNLKVLFICDKGHFDGITKLADDLGIEAQKFEIKKNVLNVENTGTIKEFVKVSLLEVSPIKIKKKDNLEKILYFFDTDNHASPFDINMAYDAGFDVVIPVSSVTADQVPKLVQDAIFSRKPKAPTTFFIGGANVSEGEKIAKKVVESLVPPFEVPVIIDPRGSHTTASSVVAKTLEVAMKHGINSISGKKVVILGTGPVARIAAIIAAKENCKTYLAETWDKATEKSVLKLTKELTAEAGEGASEIIGEFAITDEKKFEIVNDADIIWSLAAAGVQILSEDLMNKLPKNKIVIDINLVPPYGIEGVKPKHDNDEIYPGIFAVGALGLGRLKSMTESSILKEATKTKGKKIFDYNIAFEVAKEILFGKEIIISH